MLSVNSTNNSPSFKQISIVRLPQKAFQNYELHKCALEFDYALNQISGSQNNIKQELLSAFLGKTNNVKTISNLEGLLGLRLTNTPPMENYHTFVVATGDEKNQIINMASSIKNMFQAVYKIREFLANKKIPEFKIENLESLDKIKSELGITGPQELLSPPPQKRIEAHKTLFLE